MTLRKRNYLTEGANDSYSTYLRDADAAFLKEVAKGIKRVAGDHAESVEVKSGISTAWISYKGQDKGDIDLTFIAHLVPVGDFNVKLYWEYDSAMSRDQKNEKTYKIGVMTPEVIINIFKQIFGD